MLIWDRVWIGCVGLAFLALGLFVNDFRWGLRPTGPVAPTWVGRLWFIGLGAALIAFASLARWR
jgi:hypothetical protein